MRAASRRFVVMCCCLVYLVTLSVVSLTRSPSVMQTNTQTITVQDPRDEIRRELVQQAYEDLKNERSVRRPDTNSGELTGTSISSNR